MHLNTCSDCKRKGMTQLNKGPYDNLVCDDCLEKSRVNMHPIEVIRDRLTSFLITLDCIDDITSDRLVAYLNDKEQGIVNDYPEIAEAITTHLINQRLSE